LITIYWYEKICIACCLVPIYLKWQKKHQKVGFLTFGSKTSFSTNLSYKYILKKKHSINLNKSIYGIKIAKKSIKITKTIQNYKTFRAPIYFFWKNNDQKPSSLNFSRQIKLFNTNFDHLGFQNCDDRKLSLSFIFFQQFYILSLKLETRK